MHVCTLARWRVRPGGGGGAAVFYLLHRGGHRSSLAARACSTRSEWPAWMRARRGSRGGLPPVRFFFFFWVVGDLRIIFVHCRFPERLIFYFYFWLLADVAAPLAALCGGVTGVLPPCPPFMWRRHEVPVVIFISSSFFCHAAVVACVSVCIAGRATIIADLRGGQRGGDDDGTIPAAPTRGFDHLSRKTHTQRKIYECL
ncbi:hypothetical protein Tc00.1047053506529.425 [Trypanosoma cruzi]|uniref:Uncharacterized protein n=1 Tax=Trypanosoma cruzi (strain CL Brener) TaxID=353153 RepID=Q4E5N9_TRYCC|nr:hypothetical protein Tc00.1047053506529.425 [Trypanosoma cruzi]EAO00130.1 hypothetical protein Tc00.1047053506529.425 [Trypanosoma cruzi]|eukprot:XP_821981.1 hypothetical protein [Trypanosoma cruzi strain CL Brener]